MAPYITTTTTIMHTPERPMAAILRPLVHCSGSTSAKSQSPSKDSDSHTEEPQPSLEPPTKTITMARGFSTSQNSNSRGAPPAIFPARSSILPDPTVSTASRTVHAKRQPTFTLGTHTASEQGRSFETRKPLQSSTVKKDSTSVLGGSLEEEGSMKMPLRSATVSGLTKQYKQASIGSHVTIYDPNEHGKAIESSSDDYIDESAITDESDSSDWDDFIEDSSKSCVDENYLQQYLQRGDSKVGLLSCQSLITLMIAQSDDQARNPEGCTLQPTSAIASTPGTRRGRSVNSPPSDSNDAPLVMRGTHQPIREIPQSKTQPIARTMHTHGQAALSPRTTRRNMLSTELTKSLHRHVLWERSQKSSTANAVLKRRHTSHDVANLKQYPEKACIKQVEDIDSNSWSQYFAKHVFDDYHSKGW